jgi:hypothetical protein
LEAKTESITKEQIRLIKTVQRKRMADEDYYDMLMQRFKVSSCTQMTRRQASKLIELYADWGWIEKSRSQKSEVRSQKKKASNLKPPTAGRLEGKKVGQNRQFSRRSQGYYGEVGSTINNSAVVAKATMAKSAQQSNVVRMASPGQRDKIDALAGLIEWRVKDGLTKWISKRFSIQRVKTAQEAFRVIEGLKGMFERAMREKYGDGWMETVFEDPEIRRYIQEHRVQGFKDSRGQGLKG